MPVAAEAAREHSQGEQSLRVSAHLASCGKRGALAGDLVVTRGQQEGVNFAGTCLRRVFAALLAWPRKFCRWIRFCPEVVRRVAGQAMQVHAT